LLLELKTNIPQNVQFKNKKLINLIIENKQKIIGFVSSNENDIYSKQKNPKLQLFS
jgi:hypothetical protein